MLYKYIKNFLISGSLLLFEFKFLPSDLGS